MRQQQRERQCAEDRDPDHVAPADAVTDRPAEERAGRHRAEEQEQIELRALGRHAEFMDEVERVVAADARHVEILGEHQHDQDRDRTRRAQRRRCVRIADKLRRLARHDAWLVPAADPPQDQDRQRRDQGKPRQRRLAERHHDQRRQHRPHRRAEIAADLEHGLRKAETSAGGEPRNARRFRMEHRRSQTDQRGGQQDDVIVVRDADQEQAEEGEAHAGRQRERHRLLVGDDADQRLQQRRGHLEYQRDQADLREVERVVVLQDRIHRRNQRLHGVVEEMRKADAAEHGIGGASRHQAGRARRRHRRHGNSVLIDDDRLVHGNIQQSEWWGIRGCFMAPAEVKPAPFHHGCVAANVDKALRSTGSDPTQLDHIRVLLCLSMIRSGSCVTRRRRGSARTPRCRPLPRPRRGRRPHPSPGSPARCPRSGPAAGRGRSACFPPP